MKNKALISAPIGPGNALIDISIGRKPYACGVSEMTVLNLSEAIQLGQCLERRGSPLSFKGCAIGLGMAAVGIPKKTRTAHKAKELWPWLGQVSGTSLFGLSKKTYMQDIGDWYFNVRLGRMTMGELVYRVRTIEPPAANRTGVSAHTSANGAVDLAGTLGSSD